MKLHSKARSGLKSSWLLVERVLAGSGRVTAWPTEPANLGPAA